MISAAINFHFHLLFTIGILSFESHGELIAITKSAFVLDLYKRIGNREAPSESDPANGDVLSRQSICRDITSSEYFSKQNLVSVDVNSSLENLSTSSASDIYRNSDDPTKVAYEYSTNAFKPQRFEVQDVEGDGMLAFEEYVLTCLLKTTIDDKIHVYYFCVSKEYNVGVGDSYKIGRFIFADPRNSRYEKHTFLLLAEEPAEAYPEHNFKVEVEYLRRRENRELAEKEDLDPVCRLVSDENELANQLDRLCAIVLTSSYFRNEEKIEYPRAEWYRHSDCSVIKISFKTQEAVKVMEDRAEKVSYERAASCLVPVTISETEVRYRKFYISRAYKSNEVFVYEWNSSQEAFYLVNLTHGVGIVHEP